MLTSTPSQAKAKAGAADVHVDVTIVGASLAGCATATLLGRAGVSVCLIDKHSGPDAYKRLCGHYIQPSAVPIIKRLGLAEPIEAAGGVRNGLDLWTRWGLIAFPGAPEERVHGYNLQRSQLDPMIRELATSIPGVSYMPGYRAMALEGGSGSDDVVVELSSRSEQVRVKSRVVIGADGRNSTIARLAGASERRTPNTRFCCATYFSGVELPPNSPGGRLWMIGHDLALVAPNDQDVTVLAVFLDKRHQSEFKVDREAALANFFTSLPDPPAMADAKCSGPPVGYSDYELILRDPAPRSNVALVGDAGLTSDPAMAIGCGWALQSAGWLADALAPALVEGEPLAPALRRYRRERRRHLYGHHRMIALDARVRRMSLFQQFMMSASAADSSVGGTLLNFGERSIPVRSLFVPRTLGRAGLTKLTRKPAVT